jgi:hypothetical protein
MDIEHEAHWEQSHPDVLRAVHPPDNEVPVSVAFDALVASTGDLAVFVSGLRVFTNGVDLTIEVRTGRRLSDSPHGLSDAMHGMGRRSELLVGVEFSDGRRCSNLDLGLPSGPRDAPALWPGAGHGGPRTANLSLFLSPLPPPGELRLVFAWPEQDILDKFAQLPADRILEAAGRVRQLWPWEPEEAEEMEPTYPDVPDASWFAAEIARLRRR